MNHKRGHTNWLHSCYHSMCFINYVRNVIGCPLPRNDTCLIDKMEKSLVLCCENFGFKVFMKL